MEPHSNQQIEITRFHSLDAVRACALFGGIVLHAITSYIPGFRDINWPLADNSTSTGLGILFFVIHIFRMSLFFVIAGFFARLLYQRLGSNGFIKNRLQRIGLPLVAFYFLVMPFTIIAIIWGARQMGIKGPPMMENPVPVIGPPMPWGHLWFLYILLIIYTCTLILRTLVVHADTNGRCRDAIGTLLVTLLNTCTAPAVLAIPIAVSLYFASWWNQWQGIPVPFIGFIPNLPALMAYGGAFLIGWYLHRHQNCLSILAKNWHLYFAGTLITTTLALAIVGITPRFGVMALGDVERATYAFTYSFALWCWIFAAIGIAIRYCNMASTRWRYFADASYWMYIIHLPIVWLLQAWMLSWPLHWAIKLTMIMTITSVILLSSYHYLVRSTFIGKFLNGRKYPKN